MGKQRTDDNWFFKNDYEILFVFEDNYESFGQFQQVFNNLNLLDRTYNNLKIDLYGKPLDAHKQHTKVISVSKESPLEIAAFIEENWFTLFLIYLASYKDIKTNISESLQDIDLVIDAVKSKLKEVMEDFPESEIDTITKELKEILNWMNSLQVTEKNRMMMQIKKSRNVFRYIRKILIKKSNNTRTNIR